MGKHTGWAAVAALAIVLVFGAMGAEAQQGALYEVTENMYLLDASGRPVTSLAAAVSRAADASLSGWAALGTPLCPMDVLWVVPSAKKCTVNARGVDNISLLPGPNQWKGGVEGTYTLVVQDDNAVDAPEFVIETGSFAGQMDLAARPLGSVVGQFKPCSAAESCTGAAFTGRFRLPFKVDSYGRKVQPRRWERAYYLKDDGVSLMWVQPGEYSLGFATVKIELNFPAPTTTSSVTSTPSTALVTSEPVTTTEIPVTNELGTTDDLISLEPVTSEDLTVSEGTATIVAQ